jgi:hypothetical protein
LLRLGSFLLQHDFFNLRWNTSTVSPSFLLLSLWYARLHRDDWCLVGLSLNQRVDYRYQTVLWVGFMSEHLRRLSLVCSDKCCLDDWYWVAFHCFIDVCYLLLNCATLRSDCLLW